MRSPSYVAFRTSSSSSIINFFPLAQNLQLYSDTLKPFMGNQVSRDAATLVADTSNHDNQVSRDAATLVADTGNHDAPAPSSDDDDTPVVRGDDLFRQPLMDDVAAGGLKDTRISGLEQRRKRVMNIRGFRRSNDIPAAMYAALDKDYKQRADNEERLGHDQRTALLRRHIAVGEQLVLLSGKHRGASVNQILLFDADYVAEFLGGRHYTCPSLIAARHYIRESFGRFSALEN
jgi:hypothetical protein